MREQTLLKISLISALLGIFILFIISNKVEMGESFISNIDQNEIGTNTKINGVVTDVKVKGSTMIINVAQLENLDVVIFNQNFTLNKGDYIEVSGKIQEYEGQKEIIADKIILK